MAESVIELSGVWKIFGAAEKAALADARAAASKADILARHKCVVGIADASISVMRARSSASWACRAAESRRWCAM